MGSRKCGLLTTLDWTRTGTYDFSGSFLTRGSAVTPGHDPTENHRVKKCAAGKRLNVRSVWATMAGVGRQQPVADPSRRQLTITGRRQIAVRHRRAIAPQPYRKITRAARLVIRCQHLAPRAA